MITLKVKDFHDLSGKLIKQLKLQEDEDYYLDDNGVVRSSKGFSRSLSDIVISILLAGHAVKILPVKKSTVIMYVDTSIGGFRQRL